MIKPVDGGWKTSRRAINHRDWQPLSDRLFSSENEAFNFAHVAFSRRAKKVRKASARLEKHLIHPKPRKWFFNVLHK